MASPRDSKPANSDRSIAGHSRRRSTQNGKDHNHARPRLQELADPVNSARTVGLRYVTDQMPGIRREHAGKSFRYRYPTGDVVDDEQLLGRIRSLTIPPDWQIVCITPDHSG